MYDLLNLVFNNIQFNIDKIKNSENPTFHCNKDNEYYTYIPLKSISDTSLYLNINTNGKCNEGYVLDEDFGQPFPDTKDVCYEVLWILNIMKNKGLII